MRLTGDAANGVADVPIVAVGGIGAAASKEEAGRATTIAGSTRPIIATEAAVIKAGINNDAGGGEESSARSSICTAEPTTIYTAISTPSCCSPFIVECLEFPAVSASREAPTFRANTTTSVTTT